MYLVEITSLKKLLTHYIMIHKLKLKTSTVAMACAAIATSFSQAAVYDIGTDSTVTFTSSDSLTNTGPITNWTEAGNLKFNEGSDFTNVDFTTLGHTSWTTNNFGAFATTTWDGANLSGLTFTHNGHNFGYNDSFVGTDFSGATIGNGAAWNQFFLFVDVTNADFSGATFNVTPYNNNLNAFRDSTITGANFSNITWGVASSTAATSFFENGAGATSVANKDQAADFSGADMSLLTGTAKSTFITNLGSTGTGASAFGAKYDAAMLAASGWSATELDSAGWQAVPEPSSTALLGLGGLALLLRRRK